MKNLLLTFSLLLLMVFGFNNSVSAQDELTYKHNISGGVGFSLVGALFSGFPDTAGVSLSTIPALQLTYDYRVSKLISVGAAFSYQKFGMNFDDYFWVDENGNFYEEDFTADISRTNVAARVLFHYSKNPKIDMYSGLRIGATLWNGSVSGASAGFTELDNLTSGVVVAPQVILFGFRYFVTNNIGLSFESSVGAPHYLNFGVNYRL
jgi:hypothetical protein